MRVRVRVRVRVGVRVRVRVRVTAATRVERGPLSRRKEKKPARVR